MKKLKATDWLDSDELCSFVNDHNITEEYIKAIVPASDGHYFVLFYYVKA